MSERFLRRVTIRDGEGDPGLIPFLEDCPFLVRVSGRYLGK